MSLSSVLPVTLSHLMRVPVRSGTPMVIAPPLFHILGFAYMTVGLGMGMPLVPSRRFDADETLKAIADCEAGALVAVPVMLQRILAAKGGRRGAANAIPPRGPVRRLGAASTSVGRLGGLRFAGYTGGGGKRALDGLTGTGDLAFR